MDIAVFFSLRFAENKLNTMYVIREFSNERSSIYRVITVYIIFQEIAAF